MPSTNYNVQEVDLVTSLAGVSTQATGFAPGTAYTVVRDNPSIEQTEGADGLPIVSATNKKGGTLTINLLTNSPYNAVLQAYAALNDVLHGTGTFSFILRDPASDMIISSLNCNIEQPADYEGSDVAPERSWTIKCVPLLFVPV